MTSISDVQELDQRSALPPFIRNNPHEKIEEENIPAKDIIVSDDETSGLNETLAHWSRPGPPSEFHPHPLHKLTITWSPNKLRFAIEEKEVVARLWVWNSCSRTIYLHCCGLWDETARIGAGWKCYPRTRFRLAPGLRGELFIRAIPRSHSPVPFAYSGLQLAAAHMRDCVTGHFVIPVHVKFLNFVSPYMGEGE